MDSAYGKKDDLRHRAEAIINTIPEQLDCLSSGEVRQVLHELQVHQIELELQNEELRTAQSALEEARTRYSKLYHNAPVGYVVLDTAGVIKQTNFSFSRLVKHEGSWVIGKPLAELLLDEDARLFRSRYRMLLKNPVGKTMEVRIGKGDAVMAYAQLAFVSQQKQNLSESEDENELLITITDITERKDAETRVAAALRASQLREKEIAALLEGAKTILDQDDFQTTSRKVFDHCKAVVGATAGYVAMFSDDGEKRELLFHVLDGPLCGLAPPLSKPIQGLWADVCRDCKAVYHNDVISSRRAGLIPEGHAALQNVLFVPLVLQGKAVGIIGLADKATGFDDNDAKIATVFGELAAIALQKSIAIDARNKAQQERETLIVNLQEALATVKTLSGLLPICSTCKQIRDDKGYWKQIEAYIQENSDAEFSHSICPECAKKYYPDFKIYDD